MTPGGHSKDGSKGLMGNNTKGQTTPKPIREASLWASDVSQYKQFLRANIQHPLYVRRLTEFLDELESEPKIRQD